MKRLKISSLILGLLSLPMFAQSQRNDKTRGATAVNNPNDVTGRYHLPPLAKPGEGAYLSGELLYPLNHKPTPACHASTIVETPSGLIAAFFAGTDEGEPDVGIRVSHRNEGAWSWPEEVANGVQNDTLRYPCWNPVLFLPESGPLMLFYKVGPSPEEWWGMLITSTDDGKSWSQPRKLGENDQVGHLLGPVKNKPLQLADGTILCPLSAEYTKDGESYWRVHFESTQDGGKTWQVVEPINDGKEFGAIQPSILTYSDGRMQVVCRTRQNVISQSWSEDQGEHWSAMTATALPNPNAGTDAITLRDGQQLLVYNHTTRAGEQPNGRNMLNLAVSEDGKQWKPVMTLENKPADDGYSYPAIIQSSDGLVHITYTYLRESVKHVVVDPGKL